MAATGARIRVPVAVACRMLKLSTQGYYKWLKDPVSQRGWDDAHAIDALLSIHEDDPTLGYRFLTDELGDVGISASALLVDHGQQIVVDRRTRLSGLAPAAVTGSEDARGRAQPPHSIL